MPQHALDSCSGTRRRWLMRAAGGAAAMSAPYSLAAGLARAQVSEPTASATALPITWPGLTTVDGQSLPPSHWQGVPAVVVFWATWCGYCRRHNAHIDQLHRAVDGQRLRVLGVALDRDVGLVQRHLRQTGYGFPTVADGGALRQRFTERRVIPMTCTLGADGRLMQAIPGEMSADDVLALARLALPKT